MVYEKFIYLIDVIQFQCQKPRFFGQNCAMFGQFCAILYAVRKNDQNWGKSSNLGDEYFLMIFWRVRSVKIAHVHFLHIPLKKKIKKFAQSKQ